MTIKSQRAFDFERGARSRTGTGIAPGKLARVDQNLLINIGPIGFGVLQGPSLGALMMFADHMQNKIDFPLPAPWLETDVAANLWLSP